MNQVSWIVVADPVAPILTKSPNAASVCEGALLTVTITSGSGGIGNCADEYRYSTNNGTSWSSWSVTVPSLTAVSGTTLIESRRQCDGAGCNSNVNQVSWIVVADPVAPILTKSPNAASVCEGALLTVTITSGSGGIGNCADEYRYSTNNGTSWSSWSVTVPSLTAVSGTTLIESRRQCDGAGCNSNVNQVSWSVKPLPAISANTPNQVTCHNGTTAEIIFTSSIPNTTISWSNNRPGIGLSANGLGNIPSFIALNPTVFPITATIIVTPEADGCVGPSINITITVNPVPDISALPNSQEICPGANISQIFITNPNGVPGTTFSWTRDNTSILTGMPSSGSGSVINGSLSSMFPQTLQTTTFYITASAAGCTSSSIVTVTVGDVQPPVINCRPNLFRNTNPGTCTYTVVGNEFNPASFSDNCAGTTISNNFNNSNTLAGAVFPVGTSNIIWTATDASGNSTQCTSEITINDIQPPALSCKPGSPFTRYTPSNSCFYTIAGNEFNPDVFSDNCPGATLINNYNNSSTLAGVQLPVGFYQIAWTARDASGNVTQCTITINVIDNVPPVITSCPPRLTVPCPDNIPEPDIRLVSATDNCGPVLIEHFKDDFFGIGIVPGYCPDSIRRTYRITDASNNQSFCYQTIRPASKCGCQACQTNTPHFWVNLSGRCDSVWSSPSISRVGLCCQATSPERCISFSVMLDRSSVGFYMLVDGAAPPGWYYKVNCGPEVALGAVICLEPGVYHTITICKPGANKNIFTIGSVCGIIGASDVRTRKNCDTQITISGVEPSSVKWTDLSGGNQYVHYLSPSQGSLTTTFRANDLAPSVIEYRVCGRMASNPCSNNGILCATVKVYVSEDIKVSIDPAIPVFCENDPKEIVARVSPLVGNYQIRWRNASGVTLHQGGVFKPPSAGNYSVSVTELGTTLPCSTVTMNFAVGFVNCLSCPAGSTYCFQEQVPILTTVQAFRNLGGAVTYPCPVPNNNIALVDVLSSQGRCPQFLTYRYLIWDECGNRDTCNLRVEINDIIAPTFTRPPDVTIYALNNCTYNASPAVTGDVTDELDNCYTGLQATYTDQWVSGTCSGTGTIRRLWSLQDDCGNAALPQIQTITVADTTRPVSICPANIRVIALPSDPFTYVNIDPPQYYDNCTPRGNIVSSWSMVGATVGSGNGFLPTPYQFNVGVTIVTFTFRDECGNEASCSFEVRVDPRPPRISCPNNISSFTDQNVCSAFISPDIPVALEGTPLISWAWSMTGATVASGTGYISPTPFAFNLGTTVVTYTATNMAGIDQCVFSVQVSDNEPPGFTAPGPFTFCVNNIPLAIYDGMPEPNADFNPERPDWYLFRAGDTDLDMNPALFSDNCSLSCGAQIRWKITLADGTLIPPSPVPYNTGQPSTNSSDIQLYGDGITFNNVIHTITYWIVDCNGNVSSPANLGIVIMPRPNIIKRN